MAEITIRNQLVEKVVTALASVKASDPVTRPYSHTFSYVIRDDMGKVGLSKAIAIGVYDTEESKTGVVQHSNCTIRLIVEFFVKIPKNVSPAVELNAVMGEIQRKLGEDRQFGGMAMDLVELSNSIDIDGPHDRMGQGSIIYNLKYRHRVNDPYTIT